MSTKINMHFSSNNSHYLDKLLMNYRKKNTIISPSSKYTLSSPMLYRISVNTQGGGCSSCGKR